MDELIKMSACEVVELLRAGDISPKELIEKAASRIEKVDLHVNALPTRCYDRAMKRAYKLATMKGKRNPKSFLYGLPIAVKDTAGVEGVRTTYGSRIFANHVPIKSDIYVSTLEANGALIIAKSNAPEFGAGANTFNDVFGDTRNPWNTSLTSGGR